MKTQRIVYQLMLMLGKIANQLYLDIKNKKELINNRVIAKFFDTFPRMDLIKININFSIIYLYIDLTKQLYLL